MVDKLTVLQVALAELQGLLARFTERLEDKLMPVHAVGA